MKGCELCGCAARMFCESDQASLCWDCDEKVHGANFLVAKHCRSLLCQVCQSSTPWKASGPKLGPTVSICDSCFSLHGTGGNNNKHRTTAAAGAEVESRRGEAGSNVNTIGHTEEFGVKGVGNDVLSEDDEYDDDESDGGGGDDDDDDDDDYEDDYEEEEEEEEEEDGENQVVPWSSGTSPLPPPTASSSSSEDEISNRFSGFKRMREYGNHNSAVDSDDEIGCSSSHLGSGRISRNEEGNSNSLASSFRPLKHPRRSEAEGNGQADESRSAAANIVDSLMRLQGSMITNGESASATILGICRLSRDQGP